MLLQILLHTPRWVFVLFFVLLAFGIMQLATRQVSLRRAAALPLAMTGLSLYGVASAFAAQPLALLAWAAAAALAVMGLLSRTPPAGTRFDPATREFTLPGSALPLALMMGIFFTKYAVGAALSMSPGLAQAGGFAVAVSALYGAFSGTFLGRAIRLWRMAAPARVQVLASLS